MESRSSTLVARWSSGVAVFLVACASQPAPLVPPIVSASAERFFGTSISGPRLVTSPADLAFDDASAIRVRARVHWFESVPTHALTPIEDRIERIVDQENAATLHAAVGLTDDAWVGTEATAAATFTELSRADRSVALPAIESVLSPGVTMVMRGVESGGDSLPVEGTQRSAVEVSYGTIDGAPPLRVALVLEGFVPAGSVTDPDELVERREVVLLRDAPVVDGAPFLLLFTPRGEASLGAFLILIEVASASSPGASDAEREALAAELNNCAAECAIRGAIAASGPSPDPIAGIATLERDHRRGALSRLAILTRARVTLDVASAADDDTVDLLVAKLAEGRTNPPPDEDLGLTLSQVTWKFLADRMSGTQFPPALAAVALEHAGEAGRFAAVIEDVAASARSIAEIEARFVAQNRSLLEDRSPSSRVRAYEWLAARKLAPEGFDPLGALADRKKALRAAEDREAAALEAAVGGEG